MLRQKSQLGIVPPFPFIELVTVVYHNLPCHKNTKKTPPQKELLANDSSTQAWVSMHKSQRTPLLPVSNLSAKEKQVPVPRPICQSSSPFRVLFSGARIVIDHVLMVENISTVS